MGLWDFFKLKSDSDLQQITAQYNQESEENQDKKKSDLDRLFEDVGSYRSSKEYKELLDFIKKFPKIAPYNAMLLNIQKPGSRFVAEADEWIKKYRRYPKPGARPLIMLKPFGPVKFVYELNDTIGQPFPEKLERPFDTQGEISQERYRSFLNSLKYMGIGFSRQNYGSAYAGHVQLLENTRIITEEKKSGKAISYYQPFAIVINDKQDIATSFATICHELGHVLCGHLSYPKMINDTYLPDRTGLREYEKEFEAESVCWLVCERIGIKNPSAEYLSGYLNANDEVPHISIETVLKATGIIENMLYGRMNAPHKALIRKA